MSSRPARFTVPLLAMALAATFVLGACDGKSSGPSIDTVVVTSALDTIIPVGVTAQLTAQATSNGTAVNTSFDWSSSSSAIATVSTAGAVLGSAPGRAVITATASAQGVTGVGAASGTLPMHVLDADVSGIQALLADPLVAHLTAALGSPRTGVETALDSCDTGLGSGNLVLVIGCFQTVQAWAGGAADGTDRVLLATLGLVTDFASRKLNY